MRVAVFNGAGNPITIEDVEDAPLGPGDVRIEIGRCGICGSDISLTSGSPFDYATGSRMGHESAGTVIEVGSGVTSLKVGDRVSVLPRGFCGKCANCRAGRPLFCETGPNCVGGFGERLVITESSGFRFPDSVSMAEGALVEPVACGRRAFRMSRLEKGASVLVMGAGSMGLAAV
ncbi:MAG: alcohol dehydrogenase catalytic domain-containing protein, partial [Novosphingobium sp.]|nr:alcohol dehydrogenase catalytic domain-containing protein [Novosphingobium sp.]